MVADPKDMDRKGGKNEEQAENTANEELREEQLKDVAGGIDFQSYRKRTPDADDKS